jgi:dihydropyrimidinase
MIRMLRLSESYRAIISKHFDASKGVHHIDYSVHASILVPHQLKDIAYLKRKIGINTFKIYMNLGADLNSIFLDLEPGTHDIRMGEVNMSDEFIYSIFEEAAKINSTLLIHAEDPAICSYHINRGKKRNAELITTTTGEEGGREGKGEVLKVWSDCRPPYSEAQSIAKAAKFARKFGSNLYFVHIGSTSALDAILDEKQKGNSNLYIETAPHYLTHTTDYNDITGKVVPPIRSKSDIQSMWSALKNGIIDTVGSDHVANKLAMKIGNGDIWSALAGFPGVATMLPVLLSKGVNEDRIDLERVTEVTSYNTARIFGMYPKKGTIQEGSDADLVIVDLDLEQKVTSDLLQSYSDYTIYDGWNMQGWPIATLVRGKVIMENGEVNSNSLGHGQLVVMAKKQ